VHRAEVVEDHAVWTQLLCYGAVNTFIVLVALICVREVPVRLWTLVRRFVRLCRWKLRGRRWASRCLLLAAWCLATDDACNKKNVRWSYYNSYFPSTKSALFKFLLDIYQCIWGRAVA